MLTRYEFDNDLNKHYAVFMSRLCKAKETDFNAEEVGMIAQAVAMFMQSIEQDIDDYYKTVEDLT